MANGDTGLLGGLSYVAIGRETTSGTYNTCTAALDVTNFGVSINQEIKIIEQIERTRTYSKHLQQSRTVGGSCSFYFAPEVLACQYILQAAMFASVTTATVASETTGGGGLTHTFAVGDVEVTNTSLCINARKGPITTGTAFQYNGVRVADINFSASIDEPLQCNVNFMCLDGSSTSNDVGSALTVTSARLLSFDSGRVSVESSFASLTSTSFWHVQSAEWGWNNNIKSDAGAGRIGSAIKTLLPLGVMQFNAKCSMRFNTTSAYDSMIAASSLALEFEFLGATIPGSVGRIGAAFEFPRVYITNAGDPAISGPNEILTADVEFAVLRDDSSATGYAMKAVLTNTTTSLA